MEHVVAATAISLRFRLQRLLRELKHDEQSGPAERHPDGDNNNRNDDGDGGSDSVTARKHRKVRALLAQSRDDVVRTITALKVHVCASAVQAESNDVAASPALLLPPARRKRARAAAAAGLRADAPALSMLSLMRDAEAATPLLPESSSAPQLPFSPVLAMALDAARRPPMHLRRAAAHFRGSVALGAVAAARIGASTVLLQSDSSRGTVRIALPGAASIELALLPDRLEWVVIPQSFVWRVRALSPGTAGAGAVATVVDEASLFGALSAALAPGRSDGAVDGALARAVPAFAGLCAGMFLELAHALVVAWREASGLASSVSLTVPVFGTVSLPHAGPQQQQHQQQAAVVMHCAAAGAQRVSLAILPTSMTCVLVRGLQVRQLFPLAEGSSGDADLVCDLREILPI